MTMQENSKDYKYIFLDRDGTLNKKASERQYITIWDDFEFQDGVLDAMKKLHVALYKPIIITNQQCVGKGIITIEQLNGLHAKMTTVIQAHGGNVHDIFVCPHLESDNCECRKPKPGLFYQAAEKYKIDLKKCVFIGDSQTDKETGEAAGVATLLIERDVPDLKSAIENLLREE